MVSAAPRAAAVARGVATAREPLVHWFPGHMARASAELAERVRGSDGVLELRDARIPLSSTTPLLRELVGAKPRIVVLNKADLADAALETVRAAARPRRAVWGAWGEADVRSAWRRR